MTPRWGRSDSSFRLLVVDDDPAVHAAARSLLGVHDLQVESAWRGIDAVHRLKAGALDGVLVDGDLSEVGAGTVFEEAAPLGESLKRVCIGPPPPGLRAPLDGWIPRPADLHRALALLLGRPPRRPIELSLAGAEAASVAAQALLGRRLTLASEPPLPTGTGLVVTLEHGSIRCVLNGHVVAPTAEAGGPLQLDRAEPTPAERSALIELAGQGGTLPPEEETPLPPRDPGRAQVAYERGMRRLAEGKWLQAIGALEEACELAPDEPNFRVARARAEQHLDRDRAARQAGEAERMAVSEPARALALLRESLAVDPLHAERQRLMAELLLQAGEGPEAAEAHVGLAVHLAPNDAAARRLHVALLLRARRQPQATLALGEALARFPADAELRRLELELARQVQRALAPAPVRRR